MSATPSTGGQCNGFVPAVLCQVRSHRRRLEVRGISKARDCPLLRDTDLLHHRLPQLLLLADEFGCLSRRHRLCEGSEVRKLLPKFRVIAGPVPPCALSNRVSWPARAAGTNPLPRIQDLFQLRSANPEDSAAAAQRQPRSP